jgi:hypothetical protein
VVGDDRPSGNRCGEVWGAPVEDVRVRRKQCCRFTVVAFEPRTIYGVEPAERARSGLMARLGQPEPGEWHVIDNDVVVVSRAKARDHTPAEYRWVVVDPPMLASVWAAPRTRQPTYGLPHDSHPPGHEPSCAIDCPGEIGIPRKIDQHTFRGAVYSCVEPVDTWPAVVAHCQGVRPRRPDQRRRRRR